MLTRLFKHFINDHVKLNRHSLSDIFLVGEGIEIGALHNPLPVRRGMARVKYVDRMSVRELRKQYPELADKPLVAVDYITDGELLEAVPDDSQDFVIANHFIEHCQNPVLALENMIRVLKPGGVVFMAVPDKRYTFDKPRPVTPLTHVLEDYQRGPAFSKKQHFVEWVRSFHPEKNDAEVKEEVEKLLQIDYSIHYHVWEKSHMDELLAHLINILHFNFEVEISLRDKNTIENLYILRKGKMGHSPER
jgi:SAM-dependent methyltransferase